jgi:hypothetical protein
MKPACFCDVLTRCSVVGGAWAEPALAIRAAVARAAAVPAPRPRERRVFMGVLLR